MIKIFRKIRQQLLIENNFSKYMLYATGEIILVMIGILLAIQVNDMNENRKSKRVEIEYLKGIKSNINQDLVELNSLLKRDTLKLDAITNMIKFNYSYNSSKIDDKDVLNDLYLSMGIHSFDGQNIVFEDMKSSGRINLIQPAYLRQQVQDYYQYFDELKGIENSNNQSIVDFLYINASYFNVSSIVESLFNERWNANMELPDIRFSERSDVNEAISVSNNNWSLIKYNLILNNGYNYALYNKGKELINMIEQYLKEKE